MGGSASPTTPLSKSWLFAGSDRGGERAAVMYTLIQTARLNDVDPQAWLADVLARINDHNIQKLVQLYPGTGRTTASRIGRIPKGLLMSESGTDADAVFQRLACTSDRSNRGRCVASRGGPNDVSSAPAWWLFGRSAGKRPAALRQSQAAAAPLRSKCISP
jgi:hypothetical protein